MLFYRADVEKQAEKTYTPGTRPAPGNSLMPQKKPRNRLGRPRPVLADPPPWGPIPTPCGRDAALPVGPDAGGPGYRQLVEGDVEAQTHRAFDNLQVVLEDAGLTMDDVVKCNVYLTDMANFAAMNRAYQTRFAAPYPARTTVAVAGLPLGAQVEIELVARRTSSIPLFPSPSLP